MTLTFARCGNALGAWPPSNCVVTQVVRSMPFQLGLVVHNLCAAASLDGSATMARMSAATSGEATLRLRQEVGARRVIQAHWKLVPAQARQRGGHAVDRIFARWPRTVAARMSHLQPEILVDLFARLDVERKVPAVGIQQAAGAFIEDEAGFHEGWMVLQQPAHAVEVFRGFLAAGQRQGHATLRPVVLLAPAYEQVGEDRGHGLVVARTARVEKAVFLDERKRVAHPVLAASLDDVDVGQQHDRCKRRVLARVRGNQRATLRKLRGRQDLHGGGRHARPLQPRGHLLGRGRAAADGKRRVGFDQFPVQVPEGGLTRVRLRRGRCQRDRDWCDGRHGQHHHRPQRAPRTLQGLNHFFTAGLGSRGCRMDESRSGVFSTRSRCG